MKPAPAIVGDSHHSADIEVFDDFLCECSRVFAPLFGEDERGVGLVIAKTRVGRRHDLAGRRQTGGGESAR